MEIKEYTDEENSPVLPNPNLVATTNTNPSL